MRRTVAAAIGVIALAFPTGVAAAQGPGKTKKRTFTEVVVGARISASGGRFENVFRIKQSLDGGGAMIQDGTLEGTAYPVTGHDTTIAFFRDGARSTQDTFVYGPPSTEGIGPITGSGKCTGGTGFHKAETCTYSIHGTYDLNTSVMTLRMTGTDTRTLPLPAPR